MDEIIVPSDAETVSIRKEIDVAQRRKKFQDLKSQLQEITYEAVIGRLSLEVECR